MSQLKQSHWHFAGCLPACLVKYRGMIYGSAATLGVDLSQQFRSEAGLISIGIWLQCLSNCGPGLEISVYVSDRGIIYMFYDRGQRSRARDSYLKCELSLVDPTVELCRRRVNSFRGVCLSSNHNTLDVCELIMISIGTSQIPPVTYLHKIVAAEMSSHRGDLDMNGAGKELTTIL